MRLGLFFCLSLLNIMAFGFSAGYSMDGRPRSASAPRERPSPQENRERELLAPIVSPQTLIHPDDTGAQVMHQLHSQTQEVFIQNRPEVKDVDALKSGRYKIWSIQEESGQYLAQIGQRRKHDALRYVRVEKAGDEKYYFVDGEDRLGRSIDSLVADGLLPQALLSGHQVDVHRATDTALENSAVAYVHWQTNVHTQTKVRESKSELCPIWEVVDTGSEITHIAYIPETERYIGVNKVTLPGKEPWYACLDRFNTLADAPNSVTEEYLHEKDIHVVPVSYGDGEFSVLGNKEWPQWKRVRASCGDDSDDDRPGLDHMVSMASHFAPIKKLPVGSQSKEVKVFCFEEAGDYQLYARDIDGSDTWYAVDDNMKELTPTFIERVGDSVDAVHGLDHPALAWQICRKFSLPTPAMRYHEQERIKSFSSRHLASQEVAKDLRRELVRRGLMPAQGESVTEPAAALPASPRAASTVRTEPEVEAGTSENVPAGQVVAVALPKPAPEPEVPRAADSVEEISDDTPAAAEVAAVIVESAVPEQKLASEPEPTVAPVSDDKKDEAPTVAAVAAASVKSAVAPAVTEKKMPAHVSAPLVAHSIAVQASLPALSAASTHNEAVVSSPHEKLKTAVGGGLVTLSGIAFVTALYQLWQRYQARRMAAHAAVARSPEKRALWEAVGRRAIWRALGLGAGGVAGAAAGTYLLR